MAETDNMGNTDSIENKHTIKLDYDTWDLTLDNSGNLATCTGDLAIAQNVATACLVFKGEDIFDSDFGVPYKNVLGEMPSLSLISAYMAKTALTVENVSKAEPQLEYVAKERKISGQISINEVINVKF